MTPGTVLGHEAVGTVVATGAAVTTLAEGDRVLVSCISSCGRCRFCKEARYGLCAGGGGWILGHTTDGVQAELARIPFADTSLYKVPGRLERPAEARNPRPAGCLALECARQVSCSRCERPRGPRLCNSSTLGRRRRRLLRGRTAVHRTLFLRSPTPCRRGADGLQGPTSEASSLTPRVAPQVADGLQTFLTGIHKVGLLTAAQEVELAKRIEQGDDAAKQEMV